MNINKIVKNAIIPLFLFGLISPNLFAQTDSQCTGTDNASLMVPGNYILLSVPSDSTYSGDPCKGTFDTGINRTGVRDVGLLGIQGVNVRNYNIDQIYYKMYSGTSISVSNQVLKPEYTCPKQNLTFNPTTKSYYYDPRFAILEDKISYTGINDFNTLSPEVQALFTSDDQKTTKHCIVKISYYCDNGGDPRKDFYAGSCKPKGCTLPNDSKYNSAAVIDDGSCSGRSSGGMRIIATTYCNDPANGDVPPKALNYNGYSSNWLDINGNKSNIYCDYKSDPLLIRTRDLVGTTIRTRPPVFTPIRSRDPALPIRVRGCTDPEATNYDPRANYDAGNCTYPTALRVPGCTNSSATNYSATATYDDGSCTFQSEVGLAGCTIDTAINYLTAFMMLDSTYIEYDNGSCIFAITTGSLDSCSGISALDAKQGDSSVVYSNVSQVNCDNLNNQLQIYSQSKVYNYISVLHNVNITCPAQQYGAAVVSSVNFDSATKKCQVNYGSYCTSTSYGSCGTTTTTSTSSGVCGDGDLNTASGEQCDLALRDDTGKVIKSLNIGDGSETGCDASCKVNAKWKCDTDESRIQQMQAIYDNIAIADCNAGLCSNMSIDDFKTFVSANRQFPLNCVSGKRTIKNPGSSIVTGDFAVVCKSGT